MRTSTAQRPDPAPVRWCTRPVALATALAALTIAGCSGGSEPASNIGAGSSDVSVDTYTVSGKISLAENNAIDADTNDVHQVDRASNNTIDTAQALTTPVHLVGYLNVPGQGPAGASRAAGDLLDVYRVSLEAGQTIEVDFSANPGETDVDLGVFTTAGNVVGSSVGLNSYECVRISAAGEYLVVPVLYTADPGGSRGGTVYQMRISTAGANIGCDNVTQADAGVVAGQVVAQLAPLATRNTQSMPAALAIARPLVINGVMSDAQPALLDVPRDMASPQTGTITGKSAAAPQGPDNRWGGLAAQLPTSTQRVLDTISYAKQLQNSGRYRYASPNRVVNTLQVTAFPPNDREYPRQRWHYDAIELTGAINDIVTISPQPAYQPIVAVVDSGIVADHPDLRTQLVPGYDFASNPASSGDGDGIDANPNDDDTRQDAAFHGTHVAGTVAAQTGDGTGGAGVASMARIMPIKALANGTGSSFDVIQAIRFAAGLSNRSGTLPARRADIINLSLGGSSACSSADQALYDEVRSVGVIVVAASGNSSSAGSLTAVGSPANCAGVISVGATDAQRKRAFYSNGGANLMVVAPGGDQSQSTTGAPDAVFSASAEVRNGNRVPTFKLLNGTSMAAPHVAGVMALMRFIAPDITPRQIDDLIASGTIVDDLGTPGRDASFGFGQINARKAVAAARTIAGGTPPPPVQGSVIALPATLNLGSVRSTVEFELRASGNTAESLVRVSTDSPAIAVSPKAGAVDASGLGTYVITADRTALQEGSATPNVVVLLEPARTITIPVGIVSAAARGGGGDLGPVHVLVLDRSGDTPRLVARTVVRKAVNGVYDYTVSVNGSNRISVVAGTDTDNDGNICTRGEGCGAYPLLDNELSVIEATGSIASVDFTIAPFGGISSASDRTFSALDNRLPRTDSIKPVVHID